MCKVIGYDSLVSNKKHIQDEFRKWLKNKHSEWTDSTVDMHRSDAFFLYNNNIGVTIEEALNNDDGELKAYDAIKAHFVNIKYEKPDSRAEGYLRSLRFLKEFLTDKDKSKTKNNEINKHINKIEQQSKNKSELPYETSYENIENEKIAKTAQSAEHHYNQINKLCITFKKDPIFETVQEILEIWNRIRTPCTSEDDFGKFIRSLYKLIFETTKGKDQNKKDSNGRPIPIYRLPKKFTKWDTSTKLFMNTVDTLRHNIGDAHTQSKLDTQKGKKSYSEELEELLGSKKLPESREDFLKLQIGVLTKFDNAMKELNQIVKDELNPDKNH